MEQDTVQAASAGHKDAAGDRQTNTTPDSQTPGQEPPREDREQPATVADSAPAPADEEVDQSHGPASTGENNRSPSGNGEDDRAPSPTGTPEGESDCPVHDQTQDETVLSSEDTAIGKHSNQPPNDTPSNVSTTHTTQNGRPASTNSGDVFLDNPVQPTNDTANLATVADGMTEQDGDGPDNIAIKWFQTVVSGEAAAVETLLPRVRDVNIRDQVIS